MNVSHLAKSITRFLLQWRSRPWITVCSGCQRWRPKESKDDNAWMYPYTDFPPHTPNISHGSCSVCYDRLYGDSLKAAPGRKANGKD